MLGRYIAYYRSPIGILEIRCSDKDLISISFSNNKGRDNTHPFLRECVNQLDEYFRGKRRNFSLSLEIQGTTFQELIWKRLLYLPFGRTLSYQDLAKSIGNKAASRAVGNAVNKNKIAIIIPCHRVIGSNHNLTGYAGGLWRKRWLLEHEKFFS